MAMKKIFYAVLIAVSLASARNIALGPQLSLKHDANDRYIDGYGLSFTTALSRHVDLLVHTSFHSWRTGVERTSPAQAHEFYYDESTWQLGLRYWFNSNSVIRPYVHLLVGRYFDRIDYNVSTYAAPYYGLAAKSSSSSKENGSDAGLGVGFAFPILNNVSYDMSITSHAATQLNSHLVLLMGINYNFGL
jgi:hypothetical protein